MKAVLYEHFSEMPKMVTLPDPVPENDSVVIKVKATGL
jgi:D-arabinose 1-dehydrogenase-like Zn-dependent alcohol dehydrogenase